MPSAPASSCFFQPWISVGWIECWLANSATVLSPLKAAKATCALNAAMWVFRLPAIVSPFLVSRLLSSLIDCPVFGVHYTHRFLNGIVRYTETRVFYDDFTDPWVLSGINSYSEQHEDWKYPQRIDVREWEEKCAGVQVDGLAEAVAFPLYRLAVFVIPKSFFEIIRARLQ
jgi:hypothetical protein